MGITATFAKIPAKRDFSQPELPLAAAINLSLQQLESGLDEQIFLPATPELLRLSLGRHLTVSISSSYRNFCKCCLFPLAVLLRGDCPWSPFPFATGVMRF